MRQFAGSVTGEDEAVSWHLAFLVRIIINLTNLTRH